ncbi:ABC transporter permease [Salimicrobium salexigens]|uniref:ABC-2 type transport system permease protein n=1 Tax=Salimicrobium salexigens TaxID=908941 RepID=A0ABY1KX54_9BACI|nr:ABC transporter permease subunit [Salimicrobium salexigens]SIS88276.1 ABC-2 type transport system permease protein [Salimicrobium salexigens]
MVHVLKREFIESFRSVRSVLIILFLTLVAYYSSRFFQNNQVLINQFLSGKNAISVEEIYATAITFIIMAFGALFVFSISHDIVNSETESRTIRLLVTKISRGQILLGKLLGVTLFWWAVITISYIVIFAISGSWSIEFYAQTLVLIFYFISFTMLISTIISKTKLSMFFGIMLGIALPVLNVAAIEIDKWYLIPAKYILPFYYSEQLTMSFVPLIIGTVFFTLSVFIIKRRDL